LNRGKTISSPVDSSFIKLIESSTRDKPGVSVETKKKVTQYLILLALILANVAYILFSPLFPT
jgi:hypothetical protein